MHQFGAEIENSKLYHAGRELTNTKLQQPVAEFARD